MDLKQIISSVAPVLGTLLGGPVGGGVMMALSRALLGKEDGTEADIQKALATASPDTMVKLKQIEADYKIVVEKSLLESQRIHAGDRDSARKREIATRDWMPGILATTLTIGIFGVLLSLMFYPVQSEMISVITLMLGALNTVWIGAMTYYFGSSTGSKIKTKLMGISARDDFILHRNIDRDVK